MKTLDELIKQEFAEFSELKPFINAIIKKGTNDFGFPMRTVITNDGSNWEYIHEDGIYELSNKKVFLEIY